MKVSPRVARFHDVTGFRWFQESVDLLLFCWSCKPAIFMFCGRYFLILQRHSMQFFSVVDTREPES